MHTHELTDVLMVNGNAYDINTDFEAVKHLDFDPGCESPFHSEGLPSNHGPAENATWLVTYPCGSALLYCDHWVRTLPGYKAIAPCPGCGADEHPCVDISVAPLWGAP